MIRQWRDFEGVKGNSLLSWWNTLVRRESVVLLAILAVILSLWGFIEIVDEVREGGTQRFDEWALRQLRRADDPSVPVGPAWLKQAALDVTALGSIAVLTLVFAAVAGYLLLRRAYGALVLVAVSTLGGGALSFVLKQFFGRERPGVVPHLQNVGELSFPSGHAMLSAVVYLTLGALLARVVPSPLLKTYLLLVTIGLSGLVGLSRVYLGVHYPTDVLAGWSAGLVWALLCWLVARLLQRRGAVESAA